MARVREGLLWVPIFEDLLDNAKTWKLAAFMSVDEVYAAGRLLALWLWSIRKRPSGIYEPDEGVVIAKAMRWQTDVQTIMITMRDIGWLDVLKGGKSGTRLQLHDWPKYVGLLHSVQAAIKKAMGVPMAERSHSDQPNCDPTPPLTVDRGPGTVDRMTVEQDRGEARLAACVPPPVLASPATDAAPTDDPTMEALKAALAHPPPDYDEVMRQLLQAASVAKCPTAPDVQRRHLEALRVREDVGAQRLLEYLASPEAQGVGVFEWGRAFDRPRGNGRQQKPVVCGACKGVGFTTKKGKDGTEQYVKCSSHLHAKASTS